MKSSAPVYTKKNPLPPASTVKKTQYHPSCNQSLSKKEKRTTLSPVRSNQQSRSRLNSLSSEDQRLDKKHHHRVASVDGRLVSMESWPSTDSGTSPDRNPAPPDTVVPKQPAKRGKTAEVSASEVHQQDSVLAKYVERFRHGRPQSREHRQQMASAPVEEQESFWWLSPSSLPSCSTPTKTAYNDIFPPLEDEYDPAIFSPAGQDQHVRSLSALSDTSQGELDDTEILQLQERASKLLLRSECGLSKGSNPVSSDGVGTSDFSSPVTVDESVRQPVVPSLITQIAAKAKSESFRAGSFQNPAIPSLVPPTRPEEDILFQWRLRRKMEQARDQAQSLQPSSYYGTTFNTFNQQAPTLFHSASGQTYKNTQPLQFPQREAHPHVTPPQPKTSEANSVHPSATGPAPLPAFAASGSSYTQPYAVGHVPAHMHLLCDVLPCPIQSTQTGQSVSQRLDAPDSNSVHKKTKVTENSVNSSSSVPVSESVVSKTPALSGAVEAEGPSPQTVPERDRKKKSEKKEPKKTAVSTAKQKKSVRSSSHQKLPKKVTPLNQLHQQEGNLEIPSKSISDNHDLPPSPLRSALGQVVSDVLFSVEDPAPALELPAASRSPPSVADAPAQSSVPLCDAQKSAEVISQLLQEAEDSDGTEYEDDSFLQVLRSQRKWIKEQISEVNSLLREILEEQRVT